jgi:protein SMG6
MFICDSFFLFFIFYLFLSASIFSASSNGSVERSTYNQNDNFQNVFKLPFPKSGNNSNSINNNNSRQRRNSQSSYNSRENSIERYGGGFHRRSSDNNYHSSRENSMERFGNNWSRQGSTNNLQDDGNSWRRRDANVNVNDEIPQMSSKTDQEIAELTKQFKNSVELNKNNNNYNNNNSAEQKMLFDPSNPSKPIVVKQSTQSTRSRDFTVSDLNEQITDHQQYLSVTKPAWFKKSSEPYQKLIKNKRLIDELSALDDELTKLIDNAYKMDKLDKDWMRMQELREKIQKIFETLLESDMKFCQVEHVEHYFWKLLFYRIIEMLRKQMQDCDDNRLMHKEKALEIIDVGQKYFESLLTHLENCHKFKIEDFIGDNAASYRKGLGYIGLALVSAQKLFLFLGDLARYREQINQTNNFGRAKNYYVKAQQIVPRNGRPFNQLALLAVYSVCTDSLLVNNFIIIFFFKLRRNEKLMLCIFI